MMTKVSMGYKSSDPPQVISWNDIPITVGNYTSISKEVKILAGGEHLTNTVTTFPFKEKRVAPNANFIAPFPKGPVAIGSDVWIGYGAQILSGVTIGDGAVIGAFSVVASDVPPYAIYAGNPAKLIRYRFTAEQIQKLLMIKWWDWPPQEVIEFADMLTSTDIDAFINVALGL